MINQETESSPDTAQTSVGTSARKNTNMRSRWGKPRGTVKATAYTSSFGVIEDLSTATEILSGKIRPVTQTQNNRVDETTVQVITNHQSINQPIQQEPQVSEVSVGIEKCATESVESVPTVKVESSCDTVSVEQTCCTSSCGCSSADKSEGTITETVEVAVEVAPKRALSDEELVARHSHNRIRNRAPKSESDLLASAAQERNTSAATSSNAEEDRYRNRTQPKRDRSAPKKAETGNVEKAPAQQAWAPSAVIASDARPKLTPVKAKNPGLIARIKNILNSWFGKADSSGARSSFGKSGTLAGDRKQKSHDRLHQGPRHGKDGNTHSRDFKNDINSNNRQPHKRGGRRRSKGSNKGGNNPSHESSAE